MTDQVLRTSKAVRAPVFFKGICREVIMTDQVLRLIYPASLLSVPVINQLIRRYDLTVNILRAQIGTDQGWLEVQLAGSSVVIEEAVSWLKEQGVEVQVK